MSNPTQPQFVIAQQAVLPQQQPQPQTIVVPNGSVLTPVTTLSSMAGLMQAQAQAPQPAPQGPSYVLLQVPPPQPVGPFGATTSSAGISVANLSGVSAAGLSGLSGMSSSGGSSHTGAMLQGVPFAPAMGQAMGQPVGLPAPVAVPASSVGGALAELGVQQVPMLSGAPAPLQTTVGPRLGPLGPAAPPAPQPSSTPLLSGPAAAAAFAATELPRPPSPPPPRQLVVNYLPPQVGDAELRAIFEPFGELEATRVVTDRTGQSRGYGFAAFTDPACAARAAEVLNGMMLYGKRLKVAPASKQLPFVLK